MNLARTVYEFLSEHAPALAGEREKAIAVQASAKPAAIDWAIAMVAATQVYGIHHSDPVVPALSKHLQRFFLEQEAVTEADQASATPPASEDTPSQQVEREFRLPFVGGSALPHDLFAHVWGCWTVYKRHRLTSHRVPTTVLLQSSGFGKTRVLQELATLTTDSSQCDQVQSMKMLYVRMPCSHKAAEYPASTTRLSAWLFPEVSADTAVDAETVLLAQRLVTVVEYAVSHWTTVGGEWAALFSSTDRSSGVQEKITSSLPSTDSEAKIPGDRVVLLAVDDARGLFKSCAIDWAAVLTRALATANNRIVQRFGHRVGVFALFVDSHARLHTCELPPPPPPASARATRSTDDTHKRFRPFVLTQTMDAFFHQTIAATTTSQLQFYQRCVCASEDEAWRLLVQLGRPLWSSRAKSLSKHELICFAATKLMNGQSPKRVGSFSRSSRFGVASLLCRVGLRANAWSPLAPHLVADFLAVASYKCHTRGQLIAAYPSEPVLTFGAARVWHTMVDTLEARILPCFTSLLRQGMLEMDGMDTVVARLVLLLAMDATGVGVATGLATKARSYAGEFRSVWSLLTVLHGDAASVQPWGPPPSHPRCHVKAIKAKWQQWRVGFSHFVPLASEPDELTLWSLLARRAAAVLPRSTDSVDLLLPTFHAGDARVSMILVRVHARPPASREAAFLQQCPAMAFTSGNALHKMEPADVVRIHMELGSVESPRRYYVLDVRALKDELKQEPGAASADAVAVPLILCLQGLGEWTTASGRPFLSEPLVQQLTPLLDPWPSVADVARDDLTRTSSDSIEMETHAAAVMKVQDATRVEAAWTVDEGADTTDSAGDASPRPASGARKRRKTQ